MTLETPGAKKLLAALDAHRGDWIARSQLAHLLNKKYLNSGDLVLLNLLAEKGLIEIQEVEMRTGLKKRYEYRAK